MKTSRQLTTNHHRQPIPRCDARRRRWLVPAALLGLTCLVAWPAPRSQAAAAAGVALSPAQLDNAARQQLLRAVAQARRQQPAAFAALAQLRQALPRLERRQRGRLVTLVRPLRALGEEGLLPLLAELAIEALPRGELSARAWLGWRVSLLEAVGSLRDPRATPVLWAILEHNLSAPEVARSAATALARLGDAQVAARLIQRLRQGSAPLRRAVLPALGECRRLITARELTRVLQRAENGSWEQQAALRALGQVGNAGAWRTSAVRQSGEGDTVRRAALEALALAYSRIRPAERELAYKGVLLVGHPETSAILAAAGRSQPPAAREALDQLADRVVRTASRR